MNDKIKLSITVISYNQELFIKDTINSILNQQISIPYELIIGDDASTDTTPSILREYEKKYHNIVKPIYRQQNIGHTANYIETTKMCKGEYIAHLDGDDLMLPTKLQKQVDFLDSHPLCSMVHHPVYVIDKQGKVMGKTKARKATRGNINNLLIRNNIINSSNMFRRSSLDEHFYNMPSDLMLHDWLAHMVKAQYGEIGLIPEYLGSYRDYTQSIIKSASSHKLFKAEIYTLDYASKLKGVDINAIKKGKSILYLARVRKHFKLNNLKKAHYYLALAHQCVPASYDLYRFCLKLFLKKVGLRSN